MNTEGFRGSGDFLARLGKVRGEGLSGSVFQRPNRVGLIVATAITTLIVDVAPATLFKAPLLDMPFLQFSGPHPVGVQ